MFTLLYGKFTQDNTYQQFSSNKPVKFDWTGSLNGTTDRSEYSFEESSYVYLSIDIEDADTEACIVIFIVCMHDK